MSDQDFIFVKKIRKNWVLNFQFACGCSIFLGVSIAFIGFLLPSNWYVTYIGLALFLTYPFWAYLEEYFFENSLKCPNCDFNLTHGKTTDKPLHPGVAMNRLSKYKECPKCNYGN